jgi:hypothetical protein
LADSQIAGAPQERPGSGTAPTTRWFSAEAYAANLSNYSFRILDKTIRLNQSDVVNKNQ